MDRENVKPFFQRLFFNSVRITFHTETKRLECPCSVGGLVEESCCGGCRWNSADIFLIEAQRPCRRCRRWRRLGISEKAAEIGRDDIADAAVARAGDLAAGDHVPDRDMVREQHIAFSSIVAGTGQPSTAARTRQKRFCGWP